jgi:hypothetical protein
MHGLAHAENDAGTTPGRRRDDAGTTPGRRRDDAGTTPGRRIGDDYSATTAVPDLGASP